MSLPTGARLGSREVLVQKHAQEVWRPVHDREAATSARRTLGRTSLRQGAETV
jgi:hypothetical protein